MEKVNQPILIAQKSKGYVAMMVASSLLLILALVFFSFLYQGSLERVVQSICFVLWIVFFVYNTFIILLPKKLIYATEKSFVIIGFGNKEQIIPFDQIIEVRQRNTRARSIQYSFGSIIIITPDLRVRVSAIAEVDRVKSKMVELISTYKVKSASL